MTETAAHIRHLFLEPKDTYTAAEAADILGMERSDLTRLMESGELEGVRTCCGMTAVLARELLDVISAHSDYLVREISGFKAALRWPQ